MFKQMDRVILEVSVDNTNEKGVFVAEQILNVLHDTLEIQKKLFGKEAFTAPTFAFEIAQVKGMIRFFFIVEPKYRDFLEGQIYAHYPNVEIREIPDYLPKDASAFFGEMKLLKGDYYPLKIYTDFKERTEKENIDPFSGLTSALNKGLTPDMRIFQIVFSPIPDSAWKGQKQVQMAISKYPKILRGLFSGRTRMVWNILLWPLRVLFQGLMFLFNPDGSSETKKGEGETWKTKEIEEKLKTFGFRAAVRVGYVGTDSVIAKSALKEMSASLSIFSQPNQNALALQELSTDTQGNFKNRVLGKTMILNSSELAGFVHLPTIYVKTPGIRWINTKMLEPPYNLPMIGLNDGELTPIGETNFRGIKNKFGILPGDRNRHVYIIGKTGMGKTTLLENMIYDDIVKGRGVAVIDPHGDLAETILSNIPKSRTNDIIIFDPSDYQFPIAFNMLEESRPELKPLVASGLVGVFKKMFADSWGPRLEHILRNTILTLLEIPDSTLMTIPLILTQASYRKKIIAKIQDPIIEKFWVSEFEVLEPRQMTEAVSPILNKVGQFLSSSLVRNIVGQPKNPFSLRWVMDNKKILIINLSKGKIGEDTSSLLGSMLVTKFQIDAMSRADIPESKRENFYLYVDEFQNFATDSFATILSEARKYKLNLVMANQYVSQMNDTVRDAVFGNVGTTFCFQVGSQDASFLSEAMGDEILIPGDFMNLRKYNIYAKLLIDGMPSRVFSALTLPSIVNQEHENIGQKREVVIKVNREKFARPVEFVQMKINELNRKVVEEEKKWKEEVKAKKDEAKAKKSQ